MSVLGPLFIPRKDVPAVPKVKDNPELEKFLADLLRRVHTNELAVQRWANSAPRLAAVIGQGSSSANMNSADATFQSILPLDGVVNAQYSGIVDVTNNAIVMPQSGWYLISATILWGAIVSPSGGDESGFVEVYLIKNGVTATPISSSGTAAVYSQAATVTLPSVDVGVDFLTLNFAGIFAGKDTVQFYANNFVFTVSPFPPPADISTNTTAMIVNAAVEFLGATPSTVQ